MLALDSTAAALRQVRAMPLEFSGSLPLPFAQDCRVCLDARSARGVRGYHMPIGTQVVALHDAHYAHADHARAELDAYDAMLAGRVLAGHRI